MLHAAFTSALPVQAQTTQAKRAWLLRLSAATCPQTWHRCDVNAAGVLSTRPGAFCSRRVTTRPQPWPRMPLFKPAFCRTRFPGRSTVPFALLVMARTSKSSTRITSKRRARSVEVCSTQLVRRSAARAYSRARARFIRARRLEPRLPRDSRRCSRRSRRVSAGCKLGAARSSPVDRAAETVTPRSTPTTRPFPGAGIEGGMAANATCQRPANPITGHPVGRRYRDRAGPAEPHPAELRDLDRTPVAVQPAHIVWLHRHDPESLIDATLTPRRRAGRARVLLGRQPGDSRAPRSQRSDVVRPCLVEVTQRLLLDDDRTLGQPRKRGPGVGELAALQGEPRRRPSTRLPPRPLLDRQVPHEAGARTVPKQNHLLGGRGIQ